ncbi:MAG: MBL fold metallo-hydrolase [Candidatus Methanomethyliaceae archaeon]|nr:MBL fold metallo-hydrolase [Candidatus Methanomethyliaceae archaeon]
MIIPISVPFPKDWGRGDSTHSYLLKRELTVLIDAGLDSSDNRTYIRRTLKELDGLNIDYILVTHGHLDHFGLAGYLQRETGAEILVHELDATALKDYTKAISWYDEVYDYAVEGGYEPQELEKIRSKLLIAIEMMRTPDFFKPFRELTLDLGGYTLRSLSLPGHTPGSVGYAFGESVFSGDVAIEGSTVVGEFRQEMNSLQKLKSFKNIFAGHRKTPLTITDIESLETHFINRLEQVLRTVRSGMKLREVVNSIYGEMPEESFVRNIIPIRQTLSYLKYLEEEGYVVKKGPLWISVKESL